MSLHPDMRHETVAPKTVEELRRAPRPIHTPHWLLPVAVILFVLVAGIIGVSMLRSDDPTTTVLEPLIVTEEQAFIEARTGPVPAFGRAIVSPAPLAPTPDVVIPRRPQGIPGMIGYYELEFIQAKTPLALAPSPAPVGFPQVMLSEELAYIDGEYFNQPLYRYSERPQGIPGMIGYYELEFIEGRTPFASASSPASVGFPQLMTPEEAAFGRGEYFDYPVEDWCFTHRPC